MLGKEDLFDIKTAISCVAYDLTDRCLFIKDSSPSAITNHFQQRAQSNQLNAFGNHVKLFPVTNLATNIDHHMSHNKNHEKISIITPSSHLISILPFLYTFADIRKPLVVHASLDENKNSLDVLALTHAGVFIVASNTVQAAQDVSILAHVMADKVGVPVVHAFDSLNSRCQKINHIDYHEVVKHFSGLVQVFSDLSIKGHKFSKLIELKNSLKASCLLSPSFEFFEYIGSKSPKEVLVVFGAFSQEIEEFVHHHHQNANHHPIGLIKVNLYRPWIEEEFLKSIPESTERIGVLDLASRSEDSPIFLDVLATLQNVHSKIVATCCKVDVAHSTDNENNELFTKIFEHLADPLSSIDEYQQKSSTHQGNSIITTPHHDNNAVSLVKPYVDILERLFPDRLDVSTKDSKNTEFGLGIQLSYLSKRSQFADNVHKLLHSKTIKNHHLVHLLEEWHVNYVEEKEPIHDPKFLENVKELLEKEVKLSSSNTLLNQVHEHSSFFVKKSLWLIGSDNNDISCSGVHSVLSSKKNVNFLVLDTQPYSDKVEDIDNRKKDLGLYSMTYGGAYVASVALHFSYAHVLRAMSEADAFPGPSIILAYAPRVQKAVPRNGTFEYITEPVHAITESKAAIDSGYWPLYRWNPRHQDDQPPFILDCEKLKKEISEFLDRENHIALLSNVTPEYSSYFSDSKEIQVAKSVDQKVKSSFEALVESLSAKKPILVLFGSDGGNAEKLAKKFSGEAKGRGLNPKSMPMDDFSGDVEELDDGGEHTIIIFVSTAGQGEFPTNAREFWKVVSSLSANKPDTLDLSKVQFSVFAMGDSHYWPLPEDAHYFIKAGRDLDKVLQGLNMVRLTSLGVGDDQGPDGFLTGYGEWAHQVWESLHVDDVEVVGGPVSTAPTDDAIKKSSNYLRGTISQGLLDTSTGGLSELDCKLTKFHGIYQQSHRELCEERLKLGMEPAYSFMIRVRVPGGITTPHQWLAMDTISDSYANGTIKLTTRQAYQFHGVLKSNLKKTIQDINQSLMDTIAACGDVNRNVMCSPTPFQSTLHRQVYEFSCKFSEHLTPKTTAYHEIWLDKKMVSTTQNMDYEPLYGKTYLPRKFKIAIAIPPMNDVDVLAHDLGFIAISRAEGPDKDTLVGFNVTVGGGMGMTHGNKKTFPRLADALGFCTPEQAVTVGEKVMLVQRDFGDRINRKHARLKYTIEDRGIEWFREQVEKLCGFKLAPSRPYEFKNNGDRYGWMKGVDGESNPTWHYGLFVSNGRVKDLPDYQLKTALREIAAIHKGDFRLTSNQHLIIGNVKTQEDRNAITQLLKHYGVIGGDKTRIYNSQLQKHSIACVALPTCALAMAESERYLPSLVQKIENIMEKYAIQDQPITIRMTGCPNSCARPQIAEIAFIGKAPGAYNMYLGGAFNGTRLNKIYKESLNEEEILTELDPILERYAKERRREEHFGDFVIRVGIVKETKNGRDFHEL